MATKRTLKYSVYVTEEELNKIRLYSATVPYNLSIQDLFREKIMLAVDDHLSKVNLNEIVQPSRTEDK